jgi:hypothetical protein
MSLTLKSRSRGCELTLIQVAAGRSLDFIAVFNPSRRADSSGEAFAASRMLEVLNCLIDVEPEAVMVLLIANILRNMSKVKCCSPSIPLEIPVIGSFRYDVIDKLTVSE